MMCAMARAAILGLLVFGLGFPASAKPLIRANSAATLSYLANLDYATGQITAFHIVNGIATVISQFKASAIGSTGLGVDRQGRIYTAVNGVNAKPCSACIEVFAPHGKLIAQIAPPILPGAPGAPHLSYVSLDDLGDIYITDSGQQAVYMFSPGAQGWTGPTIVVQNSQDSQTVASAPNGNTVLVSGGCGFASIRPYVRTGTSDRGYTAGACFQFGTYALFGAAALNDGSVITPIAHVPNWFAVTSSSGGSAFELPDPQAQIGGVACVADCAIAYVSDGHAENVYAYAQPAKGWLSGAKPALVAVYKGFQGLDVIAVPPL